MTAGRLRLGVVQLDGIPHAKSPRDLWIPAEPLLDATGHPSPRLANHSTAQLFADDQPAAYQHIQQLHADAVANHLDEILAFLAEQAVDLAVLPEYVVPISRLPALVSYSNRRAIVAGLGYVRTGMEAEQLIEAANDDEWSVPDLLGRNVSVLVEHGTVHLVTKRDFADNEFATPDRGPYVTSVTFRDRQVRVGVAVCLDYLRHEEETRAKATEILCIPAYTAQLKDFTPAAPRDHVRLLANCAAHGGTTIMVAGLRGRLVDETGVLPISRTYEAVTIVDYDGPLQRPTSYRTPENSLWLRAEILERRVRNQAALTAIRDLQTAELTTALGGRIVHWLREIPRDSPLAQALRAQRDQLVSGFEDPLLHRISRTHVIVEPDRRPAAIRRQQVMYVIDQLRKLDTWGTGPIGLAADAYSELIEPSTPEDVAAGPSTEGNVYRTVPEGSHEPASSGDRSKPPHPDDPGGEAASGLTTLPSAMEHQAAVSHLLTLARTMSPPPRPPDDASELAGFARRAGKWIDQASELATSSETLGLRLKDRPRASFYQLVDNVREALDAAVEQLRQLGELDDAAGVTQSCEEVLTIVRDLVADSLKR